MKVKGKSCVALIFLVGVLFLVDPAYSADKPTDKYYYHHISWGETLRGIALRYYGNARAFWPIVKLNNIADPDLIIAGKTLKIRLRPAKTEPRPAVEQAAPANPVVNQPAPAQPAVPVTAVAPAKPAKWHGWRWGAVYGGGGVLAQGGTDFMAGPVVLNVGAGIGLGKNYLMADLQLSKEFELPGDCRLGLSGVYANYSKYIADVPWIDGRILNKGDNLGLGIYVSKDVNEWEIKAGYSPILGPTFGLSRYL